jgi:hypothetical protein
MILLFYYEKLMIIGNMQKNSRLSSQQAYVLVDGSLVRRISASKLPFSENLW